MDKHVTLVGALYIAFSALGIFTGLIVLVAIAGGGLLSGDSEAIMITSGVGITLFLFFMFISIPGLIGGIGVLRRASWARILVIILSILNLANIPIGTVLGIYSLWALLNSETEKLFSSDTAQLQAET